VTLSVGTAGDAVDLRTAGVSESSRFAFPARWRAIGLAYVLVTAPLSAFYFADARGEAGYLSALVQVGMVYWLPGFVIAVVACRRTDPSDRRLWRVWAALFGSGVVLGIRGGSLDADVLASVHTFAVPTAIVFCLALTATNMVLLHKRSGERTVAVDALDLVAAGVAVVVPIACLFGAAVVMSSNAWFTVSSVLWAIGAAYCTASLVLVRGRVASLHRATVDMAIALGVVTVVNTVGQAVYGVHDFGLPSAPFLGLHALCEGMTALLFLWALRVRAVGLERFTPRAQVRGRPGITILILATLPLTAGIVWVRRDVPWVLLVAVGGALLLVAVASVRVLVSARETARLYSRVAEADDERRELLNEVMLHADADRHRVAAHLHRQSAALYTAVASLTMMYDRDEDAPTGLGLAAERLKADLARQSDDLRQLAVAVRPIEPARGNADAGPLVAPITAYVDRLYREARRPAVTVRVDPSVDLEWTTEAIALRIVQEAILNAWRHAKATAIEVVVGVDDGALAISITDDGVGFDADAVGEGGNGMAALRAMARFLDAEVVYETGPGEGTTVRVVAGVAEVPVARRPRLRVVRDS
jgi:signal transduction histidine kinase